MAIMLHQVCTPSQQSNRAPLGLIKQVELAAMLVLQDNIAKMQRRIKSRPVEEATSIVVGLIRDRIYAYPGSIAAPQECPT